MQIFIDSGNLEEIKEILDYGLLDGVTTNPSLIKKEVENLKNSAKTTLGSYIKQILKITKGKRVSLEVVGKNYNEMIKEGLALYKKFNPISKNIYIKIPIDPCLEDVCSTEADGIKAIKFLSSKKIPVNCTLIFTPEQAFLAAKAGAKIVSPFAGREDDYIREMASINFNKKDYFPKKGIKKLNKLLSDNGIVSGVDLITQCKTLFKIQKITCEILAASIRSPRQFREVALAGADIVTMPYDVIKSLLRHHKTSEGMRQFTHDLTPEYENLVKK
ncbi:MAG: transaldolase family protein [Nanoarchaeota archaeon]|nr:transaldolase family protein [Nanoarchaeota archaeon]